jgi:hypothetical protein
MLVALVAAVVVLMIIVVAASRRRGVAADCGGDVVTLPAEVRPERMAA